MALDAADYPYTTQRPHPVMMPYENLQIQLVDTPPVMDEVEPAFAGMVRRSDETLLVVDLSTDDCFDQGAGFPGQTVSKDFVLQDGDIVELHV